MEDLKTAVKQDWTIKSGQETIKAMESSDRGLTSEQVHERILTFGANEIARGKPTRWYVLLGRQFVDPLIYILLAAAVVTGLMGHFNDVIIIMTVLIVNALIGFYQESKAERAINNIKGMSAPECKVRRNGEVRKIQAKKLVPGDYVILEEGDRIPADARVIKATRLQVEESIFTGESVAASKNTEQLEEPAGIADKSNMVFMGTHVTAGHAEIIVTATAMDTELGKIAGLVQSAEDIQTPLQKKVEDFGNLVIKAVIGICGVIFVSSYLVWGYEFEVVLLNAIAIAVSAIPEGLPVIITLVLAVGVRRMAKHNALIRKLPTVETLGSATVVCTDKTGTLTRNEMVVTHIFAGNKEYKVTGEGYSTEGEIKAENEQNIDSLEPLIKTAALCNNASVKQDGDKWLMIGDATEGALVTLSGKYSKEHLNLRDKLERKAELPFDSKIKFMVTVHEDEKGNTAHLKGSFEAVLSKCTHILDENGKREISEEDRKKYSDINYKYASDALRVIAFASKKLDDETAPEKFVNSKQKGYTFLGLTGMIDLPRTEATEAVRKCRKAGIKVVMITGDHLVTARAVGKQVGLYDDDMESVTGAYLEKLSDEELKERVMNIAIYARTSPEDKMRIIQALKSHNQVVSMTGDGVNDAPALTRADIGVAMGQSGTDVAKEAAGMILVDDNFASIVAAVEEGRIIFNNLRKAIGFLVSTNVGEVLIFLISSLLGLPAPLKAAQILWVNLVTDGTTSIALGVEPAEGDEMEKHPREPGSSLLSKPMKIQIAVVSILMCIGTLFAYHLGKGIAPDNDILANTMAFCTVVFFQLFNIFNCRSYEKSLFKVGLFGNLPLVGAFFLALALQLAAIYIPFMQDLFSVTALNLKQMGYCLAISFSVIPVIEIVK
ncbi:MAG: cation-translocating P-type ATPase, partial [Candidatus Rifleibacteriota bacterium]